MAGEYRSLKKQHYLNLIKECASSGKNKQQWCSENGIKYSTFMRWKALQRDEVADQVMEQLTYKLPSVLKRISRIANFTEKRFHGIIIYKRYYGTFLCRISRRQPYGNSDTE